MSIELRDYQIQITGALRTSILEGNKRIVLCAPT
jgi:superfamily II DNA or RNA helicase